MKRLSDGNRDVSVLGCSIWSRARRADAAVQHHPATNEIYVVLYAELNVFDHLRTVRLFDPKSPREAR